MFEIQLIFLYHVLAGFVDHVEKVWQAMEDDLATEISSIDPWL